MSTPRSILWLPIYTDGDEHRSYPLDTLAVIRRDDPAVLVRTDPESDGLLFSGTSLEHLQEIFDKITDEYRVPAWKGEPRVRYIETIRHAAEGEGKYIRQTGGFGNYGHVKLRADPREAGNGPEFVNEIVGGVVPEPYIVPIEEGVREAAMAGILAGHEFTGLRVTLYDGSFHELDSNPMAFRIAASLAFQDAAKRASPVVLEPVMTVVLTVMESNLPATLAEISARRGRVTGTNGAAGLAIVQASIPLAEMLRDTDPAPTIMEFEGFEPVSSRRDDADPAASAVRNPSGPKPRTNSAAAEPELDIGSDWT
ncbi:MAG: hypothetical protein WA294_09935 [Acidobacteriaceae bacterium]